MNQRQYIDFKLFLTRPPDGQGCQVALLPTPEVGETITPVNVPADQLPTELSSRVGQRRHYRSSVGRSWDEAGELPAARNGRRHHPGAISCRLRPGRSRWRGAPPTYYRGPRPKTTALGIRLPRLPGRADSIEGFLRSTSASRWCAMSRSRFLIPSLTSRWRTSAKFTCWWPRHRRRFLASHR